MHDHDARSVAGVVLAQQRVIQHRGHPRVAAPLRELLIGEELGLHRDPRRAVERFYLVADRPDGPLGERHQPGRGDADRLPGRGDPFRGAAQRSRPEVEHALVGPQLAVADVEGLVVDVQPDQLAVRHVDDRLPGLREPVARLGVRQGPQREHAVEVGARQAMRLALVQVAAPAQVPVGQREHRLRLGQQVLVQGGLPEGPGLDREGRLADHGRSSSSARSVTTTSAPWAFSAAACPTRSTPTT